MSATLRTMVVRAVSSGRCIYRPTQTGVRLYSDPAESRGEQHITTVLREKFPGSTYVKVEDISGGCGSMYDVQIQAKEFVGKRMVQQHRMVNEALKAEIQSMHGLRISTALPEEEPS